jgi:EAL domain-containing protein (putative c-di-GMP-specific phosphodiesterase class I)
MSVVAEGIETATIARRLTEVGCDIGQGWYFGRAMPEVGLEDWLARQAPEQG